MRCRQSASYGVDEVRAGNIAAPYDKKPGTKGQEVILYVRRGIALLAKIIRTLLSQLYKPALYNEYWYNTYVEVNDEDFLDLPVYEDVYEGL